VAPRNRNTGKSRQSVQPAQPPDSAEGGDHHILMAKWDGPLPPPAALREFDELVPNGAERIFAQFEAEASHRRECEAKHLRFGIRDAHIGQFLAGLYAVCAFGVSAFAIYKEAYWAASFISGTTIVGGIVAFLRQKE
jgi:uncharacterized membrane protein